MVIQVPGYMRAFVADGIESVACSDSINWNEDTKSAETRTITRRYNWAQRLLARITEYDLSETETIISVAVPPTMTIWFKGRKISFSYNTSKEMDEAYEKFVKDWKVAKKRSKDIPKEPETATTNAA